MASKQVTKRLLHELRSYEKDPSDALLQLGPINDEELTHWTAVLKGVSGTAYQSISDHLCCPSCSTPDQIFRRPLETQHRDSRHLSQQTSYHHICYSHLSSECAF